jgi:hypothetical protein
MSWVNVGVVAAGMLAKYKADKDAENRQSSLRGGMEQYQRGKAQQNEAAINQLMSKQTAPARAAELASIDASREASMRGAVDQARAASPVTQVAGTNTSPDYQQASQAASTRVADRTAKAIQQLGLMGAPGEQGVASGIRFGRTAGNVDANNIAIGNVGDAYMRDINNVKPNPWLNMAGDAAIAYGTGGMFAPAAGAAGATSAADAAAFEGGAHLGGGASTMAEGTAGPMWGFGSAAGGSSAAARAAAMRGALAAYGRRR